MGVDINTHIFRRMEDGSYKELILYKSVGADVGYMPLNWQLPYNNRDYALFDVLAGTGRGRAGIDEPIVPPRGAFPDAPQSEELDGEAQWNYGYTYFDWCELKAFSESPKAEIVDWDEVDIYEDETYDTDKLPRRNVLKPWLQDLGFVLECYGAYYPRPGEIIIQVSFNA